MIRVAGAVDLPAVVACVEAAFKGYIPLIGKPPGPMLVDYAPLIERRSVHLLEHEGALMGLIVMEPCPDHLFVETLAVHPDHQRKGVGARLMRFAETEAQRFNLPEMRLYTHAKMAPSLAFYDKLGFAVRERRTESGYDRIYLTRPVEPAPTNGSSPVTGRTPA